MACMSCLKSRKKCDISYFDDTGAKISDDPPSPIPMPLSAHNKSPVRMNIVGDFGGSISLSALLII